MTRILIIGSSSESSIERHYQRAFDQIGLSATLFDPEAPLARIRRHRILNRATWSLQHRVVSHELDRFFANPPACDAVLIFKGYFIPPDTIRRCRLQTPGATWANINPDSPFDPGKATSNAFIRQSIPLFDTYFIWSHALIPRLQAAGSRKAVYLPFGYDPAMHFPAPELDPALSRTVTFVGSYDRQRAEVLEVIADLEVSIYGNAWEDLPASSKLRGKVISAAIYGAPLRQVVTSSLASINILRPQNVGSHNMRTFEVPAMGGLMLTSYSEEQQAVFPDREACLMYRSPAELRSLVMQLAAGAFDTQRIRVRALAISRAHSYAERAREILRGLGLPQIQV